MLTAGLSYLRKKNYEYALTYLNETLKIKQNFLDKNSEEFVKLFDAIGLCYAETKQPTLALKNYLNELEIQNYHKQEDESTATLYSNLGTLYGMQGDRKKSINCCLNSLKILEKFRNQNDDQIIKLFFFIGYSYIIIGEKEKGLSYINNSGISDSLQIGKTLLYNGLNLRKEGEFKESIKSLEIAKYFLVKNTSLTAQNLTVEIYKNLCLNYCSLGEKALAKAMIKDAIQLSKKIESQNNNTAFLKKIYKECKSNNKFQTY